MGTKYQFRAIKSSWGISIDIVGDHSALESQVSDATKLDDQIWIQISANGMGQAERSHLVSGLRRVSSGINRSKGIPGPILIRVTDVNYNPCDFQIEGLECAIALWSAQEFGFPEPKISTTFNKKENKYYFSWENYEQNAQS